MASCKLKKQSQAFAIFTRMPCHQPVLNLQLFQRLVAHSMAMKTCEKRDKPAATAPLRAAFAAWPRVRKPSVMVAGGAEVSPSSETCPRW